ncbi:hypothetical protein [Mesorhizobium sp. M0589]|uniref:effector-associated constant component EACC1 n=1 Tax=Mesorhizobium sp. M0589 TaxID=2956965 RepID=UPI003338C76C
MGTTTFQLRPVTDREDEASQLARALKESIDELAPEVKPIFKKKRKDTQDFGTTLVLVLGAPATVALATAIATFIRRNSGVVIEMTSYIGGSEVNVTGTSKLDLKVTKLNSADAKDILVALASK